MSERSFVLLPLQEVDQFWVHPTSKMSILDLINALKNDIEIKKI
jgi:7,8-dihydro-6-hydroxymethylpterin-pyrophosphokinase